MNKKMIKKDATVSNAAVRNSALRKNIKAEKPKIDIKQRLKLLESGELKVADVEAFADEFMLTPQLGDHIQYELHRYCKDAQTTNTDLVVKLAELCYSKESVSYFSNIDRFVGCVYYISSYLLKREKFKPALDIISSLFIKKNEVVESSKEKAPIRSYIYILHGSIIASAISVASKINSSTDEAYKTCHSLVIKSLNIFQLTAGEQPEVGRKVLKATSLYLQTLKHHTKEDVVEFYQALQETFKILLPQMGSLDYFLYFLSKVYQMKKPDSDADVHQILKKTVDLMSIFLNSSQAVRNVLNKILDFFWVNCSEKNWITDEEFALLNANLSHSDLHFLVVSVIFSYGIQFLWTKFEKSWCENVTVEVIKKVSKTVLDFHRSQWENRRLYCPSGKAPFEICYGDLLTGNLQKIQYTVRLCLKNKLTNTLSLITASRDAFKLAMECLERMKKIGCCQKQIPFSWKFSVIHHTNTVEDIFRLTPSDESWFFMKECSQEILREVVNSEMELPFDYSRLKILFQRWHFGCLKLQNYQQALYACVVYYVFYPKEERDIMSMWIQTKSDSSNEILQEITMVDFFKTHDQNLRDFSKTYNSSKISLKSVLLMELKAYGTCLPDTFQNPNMNFNLVTRIWKKLGKFKLEIWESSLVMSCLISACGNSEELPKGFQEECQQLIDTFVRQGSEMKCRILLHAANLKFSIFLYNVKMSERSLEKTETTQMVLGNLKKAEEEKVKFGEDEDLNLTCDVIPSSRHLTVELETNCCEELTKIVGLWNDALKSGLQDLPSTSEFELWLRNVKHVANMYEMFGEYQKALATWFMFYRIGKLCGNSVASLLGLSHLIKNCSDVDSSGLKPEAELISGGLGSEASEKHVLVEYFLAMASNYLKNKKTNKCLEYLCSSKKILEGLQTTIKSYTLNAKFWCLVSQFLVLYKEYEAVFGFPLGTDVRIIAFRAFRYANGGGKSELIKSTTQLESTEHVLAMLEVNLWLYYLHGVYRQTDFMRFFLDDLYQIVQKLFLPTRTAEILARLAQVDMICEKDSDCQEKVMKLKSILTTLSSTCGEGVKSEKVPDNSRYLKVPQQSECDGKIVRAISPVRFLNEYSLPKDNDLSPILSYLKDAKASKTEKHLKKCKCRLCQNLLIQTLTMNTVWLEAEIQNLKNCTKQATAFYSQACEILDKLMFLTAEQSNLLRLELASVLKEDPGELEVKLSFVQFQSAAFLIRYALFESASMNSVTENVLKTILRVSKLMKKFSYEEKLLQWTFTELKLFCVVLNKRVLKPQKKNTPEVLKTLDIEKTKTPLVSAPVGKTPVNSQAGNPLKKTCRPCPKGRKISFEDEKNSTEGAMSTAVVTVKKATKEKPIGVPSRKLDFNTSGDIFEEKPAASRTVRQTRKTTVSATATITQKEGTESVKIYVDSKANAKKSNKNETKKMPSKTRKK